MGTWSAAALVAAALLSTKTLRLVKAEPEAACTLPLPETQKALLDEVTVQLHHNGYVEPCGSVGPVAFTKKMTEMLTTMDLCASTDAAAEALGDKYMFETYLTNTFHYQLWEQGDKEACISYEDDSQAEQEESNVDLGFFGFCDMGAAHTPPQPDEDALVLTNAETLPCRYYTREGVRISSLTHLVELVQHQKLKHLDTCGQEETCAASTPLDIYAVPAGRVFMFAPAYVGEIFKLDHIQDASGNPLSMEVLSLNPRVFDIFNFFSVDESQQLIDKALRETSSTHGLHRSTTGATGGSVFSKRTSENAWDTHGKLALIIKK